MKSGQVYFNGMKEISSHFQLALIFSSFCIKTKGHKKVPDLLVLFHLGKSTNKTYLIVLIFWFVKFTLRMRGISKGAPLGQDKMNRKKFF
jgi:hypothetical protein